MAGKAKGMTDLALAANFEEADEKAWRTLAERALKDAKFETTLTTTTLDGLAIKPLYAAGGDAAILLARKQLSALDDPPWDVRQLIACPDPGRANRAILTDLEGGATSIALRLAAPEQAGLAVRTRGNFAHALDGVYLDLASIALEPGINFSAAAEMLMALWSAQNIPDDKARGDFGADPLGACARAGGLETSFEDALGAAASLARITHETYPQVTALTADGRPYHDGGASEAQELACLAATAAAYLRAFEATGLAPCEGMGEIVFALASDADLFLSIAKLRAARMVIGRIAQACGAASASSSMRLTAETSARMMTKVDPHMNLLRATAAATAAILGSADVITVLPFNAVFDGEGDAFGRRIARNIQLILQKEAHLGRVLDAPGGSWYLDALSHALAHRAWQIFQQIEAKGGMAQALAQGFIQAMLRETADARQAAIATSHDELIGVNAFPKLGEAPFPAEPCSTPEPLDDPAVTVEPVPLRRPSEPFEALRGAAYRDAAKTGQPPQVFLANLGRVSDFNVRANYARDLFAAGGIEANGNDGFASAEKAAQAFKASDARIACLCASDEVYGELGQVAAGALTEAGAAFIFLAGRPGNEHKALRRAGVGAFVHKGCDMIATLGQVLDALGIARP